jgi:hypothetical protein
MKPLRAWRMPHVVDAWAPSHAPLLSRLAWMLVIWAASIIVLAVVAGALRLALVR